MFVANWLIYLLFPIIIIFSSQMYAIQRDELVAGLRKTVREHGIEMRHNYRLQKIEEENNKVTAHFKNGETATTITADLLVGCDGIHSITRQYVTQDASQPSFSGMSTILGLATLTPEEEKEFNRTFSMWVGEDSFFGVTEAEVEVERRMTFSPTPPQARHIFSCDFFSR
jgi:2-polyprenyl-6-methoxyphenol hydroxylase-like FAD-dependent oxidoreductase